MYFSEYQWNILFHHVIYYTCNNYFNQLVDIYPFKFEIMQALMAYFKQKKVLIIPGIQTQELYLNILQFSEFAFQLMFLKYKDKQKIIDFINKNNIYQNVNYTSESIEYLESLPPFVNVKYMLDKDSTGFNSFDFLEVDEIFLLHEGVVNIIKNYLPKYKVL